MINQNPRRSDEPIWWTLFGAGGTWFAMVTPVTILILGILLPLGVEKITYTEAVKFTNSLIGALFIIATLSLPMWHAMHRVLHGMHDLKIHLGVTGKVICYGIAALVSALAVVFVLML